MEVFSIMSRRRKKAAPKAPAKGRYPSGLMLIVSAVAVFIAIAVLVALIARSTSDQGSPTPPATIALRLTPTLEIVPRLTPFVYPTSTTISVSPDGVVAQPAPDWDALYAPLSAPADDWQLLIVHSNDTWGYLPPCG